MGLNFTGIIHVGIHECEEIEKYIVSVNLVKIEYMPMSNRIDFCIWSGTVVPLHTPCLKYNL